ncbi:MAG: hypothetical protein HUJ26_13585 [Planctomycetaceae bacterium]|nr:hypothetical protein [Planctomycetaceae bacterium]
MSKASLFWFIIISCCAVSLRADDLAYPHEEREPEWKVVAHPQQVRVLQHLRQKAEVYDGSWAEQIGLDAALSNAVTHLVFPIPSARMIDDLKATVAFRSNRSAATLCFQVRLPNQKDPESGRQMTFLVPGETSSEIHEWQLLHCQLKRQRTEQALQLLRARLQLPQLNTQGMYVDAVVCKTNLPRGQTSVWLDDLKLTGHIGLDQDQTIGRTEMSDRRERPFPVRMELDRLYVDDHPRFPVMIPHHGEPVRFLTELGVNTVWIPEASNQRLAQSLRQEGLLTMATPPRPRDENGLLLDADDVSLAPFGVASESIMFWYLGTQIPIESSDDLVSWQTQVSDADRKYQRPIIGDVAGREEFFTHYLDMVGTSRPVGLTGTSYREYRDWLTIKHRLFPGAFFWTWIDIDAGSEGPQFLEPEQIRLQVYAALSSGCRGLGYYTRRSLNSKEVENTEHRLMIAELNREISLMEPMLATGTYQGTIPVVTDQQSLDRNRGSAQRPQQRLTPESSSRSKTILDPKTSASKIEAAMIQTDMGLLLLPVWYDPLACYVPGQMATNKATITVPGVPESAAAFQITPTGINNLEGQRETGGMKLELVPNNGMAFRETSAILITTNIEFVKWLQKQTRHFARGSAMDNVLMARTKWERVKKVDELLTNMGHPQEAAKDILERSRRYIEQGEVEIERGQFSSARLGAGLAMQLLRILQRQHWEATISTLPHPATSPYATSFQSLPEHWELVQKVGRQSEYEVLSRLASGDFEDVQKMFRDGWQHQQVKSPGVESAAELYPTEDPPPQTEGQFSLRLATVPLDIDSPPALVSEKTVQVATPPVSVKAGDIVYVSGWVRVRFPASNRLDHALISDSVNRASGCIRLDYNRGWHKFELLREINDSGPFQVFFELEGLGEMQIDDVEVVTLQPRRPAESISSPSTRPGEPSIRDRARDLFNRIPGVDRLPNLPGFEQEPR